MKRGDRFKMADEDGARAETVEYTGEFRAPRKGEIYLSGAIIEGYVAHSDHEDPEHIACPVCTNCGQWVRPGSTMVTPFDGGADCFNECAKRGFA